MTERGVNALLLGVGPDLPWLTGFAAMPLERLTMLVLTTDKRPPALVVPELEVDRVHDSSGLLDVRPWGETTDPVELVIDALDWAGSGRLAIGDHTWSRFLVALQSRLDDASWTTAGEILGPLRAHKDEAEIEALSRAGAGIDAVIEQLQKGDIPLIGRTEAQVAADIRSEILNNGHDKVNFCIVASGPNSASPHHDTGAREIQPGEPVLFDIGGTTAEPDGQPGYCSDCTRMVFTGEPPKD